MLRVLFYSLKHALLYRASREVSRQVLHRFTNDVKCSDELQRCKTLITNVMLMGAGLRVVSEERQVVPRFTYLTQLQRELIATVTPYGFKVGTL